jgi:hypothetical protein
MSDETLTEAPPEKNNFSWLRIGKIVLIVLVLAGVLVGGWFLATSRPVKIAWASLMFDRRENYLDCYSLPFYPQVQKALNNHSDIVQKLKLAGGGQVTGEQIPCTGWAGGIQFIKGDIVISYQSRQQRQAVEKLIGDNFFGIAYRGEPVK